MRFLQTALFLLLGLSQLPAAELRVFPGFGTGTVLQRGKPVPLWGWGKAGDEVTVAFADQRQRVSVQPDGTWRVTLTPLTAAKTGRPLTITTAAGAKLVSEDVVVGEVWFCAGQSNMALEVRGCATYATEKTQPENRLLRTFRSSGSAGELSVTATTAQTETWGQWVVSNPQSLATSAWSAVAFYAGKKLQSELDVPVGLITSAVGATAIQAWLPAAALERTYPDDPFSKMLKRLRDDPLKADASGKIIVPGGLKAQLAAIAEGKLTLHKGVYTSLYNGLVAPHAGTAISGFLWYQGEANRGDGMRYATYMRALIDSWREAWGDPQLTFIFAQIAPYQYKPTPSINSAELWEAQIQVLADPHTAYVTTFDVGDLADIHPTRKQPVGERMADQALRRVYGKQIVSDPPFVVSTKVAGKIMEVRFNNVGTGLRTRDGKQPTWFTVAGADGTHVPATATIVGTDQVQVQAAGIATPVAVRFGWLDTAEPNLVNSAGLPAAPFRSDPPAK